MTSDAGATVTVGIADDADRPALYAVRHEVFVDGQGVPADLEVDGLDDVCVHLVARVGDAVVGTARVRSHEGHPKVERVAVRAPWRGRGLGVAIMAVAEQVARDQGGDAVHLHAQAGVIAFYEALGYVPVGERFHEAGIEHVAMVKQLA